MPGSDINNLVFLDESGININMTRHYARSKTNEWAVDSTPLHTPCNTTILSLSAALQPGLKPNRKNVVKDQGKIKERESLYSVKIAGCSRKGVFNCQFIKRNHYNIATRV